MVSSQEPIPLEVGAEMSAIRARIFCILFMLVFASSARSQLPITSTQDLPLRVDVPVYVELYVLGKPYSYLEFTWDQERDAVFVNGALFYAGPGYIPPEHEIVVAAENNDFVRYLVETKNMSWTEAYRVYKEKMSVFGEVLARTAADLESGAAADSTIISDLARFLEVGDYGRLIDLEYGIRISDGHLKYRRAGGRFPIAYIYRPNEGPIGLWHADKQIQGFLTLLETDPNVPCMIVVSDGGYVLADGFEATDKIRKQIQSSQESGVPEGGPLPRNAVSKFLDY